MEERILDDDESRGIKLKRTTEGGTDAVDALAERAARAAHEESERLKASADEKLAEEKFADAELLYAQALVCDAGSEAAAEGLWTARTKNFTDAEAVFAEGAAEELAGSDTARALVVEKMGKNLNTLRDLYAKEEAEIAPAFEEEQETRREAFAANKRYYLVRFAAFLLAAVLFAIGIAVSGSFLLRTQSNLPVILMGVFGGLTLVAIVIAIVYSRKLYVASSLYGANEKLSSTETGARIAFLRERLYALALVFGETKNEEREESAESEENKEDEA